MKDPLTSTIAIALTWALIHFLWQGSLVALGYQALRRGFGIRSASIGYAAALAALVMMTACPVATLLATYRNSTSCLADTVVRDPVLRDTAAPDLPLQSEFQPGIVQRPSAHTTPAQPERTTLLSGAIWTQASRQLDAFAPYLLGIWFAGVMFGGARLLAGSIKVISLHRGRSFVPVGLSRRSKQLAARLGLREARVFASSRICEAAVIGFWRPVVLIPASWITAMPTDVLEAVIAHELAHIRRYDVWINLTQRCVETLLFFHPAVWWLSGEIRRQREMCCDEMAVWATGQRASYAVALEQVGRIRTGGILNLATSFGGEQKMNLLHRVKNVLNASGNPRREPAWMVGAAALIFPLLVLGWSGLSLAPEVTAQEREGGRSAEAEKGPNRSPEADLREQLVEFQPQTEREKQMMQAIIQLRREIDALRRGAMSRRGEGDRAGEGNRDSVLRKQPYAAEDAESFSLPRRWRSTKEGKVFQAYDHNENEAVELDEWLAMTNGNINSARRELQARRFNAAEPSGDGKFTPEEFIYWYKIGRHAAIERDRRAGLGEDGRPRKGPRDGDATRRGPRDGEGVPAGPRDRE